MNWHQGSDVLIPMFLTGFFSVPYTTLDTGLLLHAFEVSFDDPLG